MISRAGRRMNLYFLSNQKGTTLQVNVAAANRLMRSDFGQQSDFTIFIQVEPCRQGCGSRGVIGARLAPRSQNKAAEPATRVKHVPVMDFVSALIESAVAVIFSGCRAFAGRLNRRRLGALQVIRGDRLIRHVAEQNATAPPKRQVQRGRQTHVFYGRPLWRTHQWDFSLWPALNASMADH
jgi:hypothetical protein